MLTGNISKAKDLIYLVEMGKGHTIHKRQLFQKCLCDKLPDL